MVTVYITKIYGNYIRSICLCILVCNYKHVCYLLNDIYILSEEGTGWDQVEPVVAKIRQNVLSEERTGWNRWV